MTEKKINMMIAMPCYGSMLHCDTMQSLIKFIVQASAEGIGVNIQTMSNESLITRARNWLASSFIENPQFTHFMFIDADISFEPEEVLRLIAADRDICAGVYPFKRLFYHENLSRIEEEDQHTAMLRYVVNPANGDPRPDSQGFIEVLDAATGFMLIKRESFEIMMKAYPDLYYTSDMIGMAGKKIWNFFDTMVEGQRYLSEDYAFCRLAQRAGLKIYVDVQTKLTHHGNMAFEGNLMRSSKLIQELASDPSQTPEPTADTAST